MSNNSIFHRPGRLALLGILGLLISILSLLQAAGAAGGLNGFVSVPPSPLDPLTSQEVSRLEAIAGVLQAPLTRTGASSEVLLIQRYDAPKARGSERETLPRRGEIYLYNYATDSLHHTVVNIQSGELVSSDVSQDVQLPLTSDEKMRALNLIVEDEALWSRIRSLYRQQHGESLMSMEKLQAKTSIFRSDAMPDRVNEASALCGLHRCAQILLYGADRTAFELTPIVDLSSGRVVQVLEWG